MEEEEEQERSPPKKATKSSLVEGKKAGRPSEVDLLRKELNEAKAAREEDRRVRQELEKKLARFSRSKHKSSVVAAESTDDDSCKSESSDDDNDESSRGSVRSTSVNARYLEYRDLADDIEMVIENAKLKRELLLRQRAMNKPIEKAKKKKKFKKKKKN